jgi:hypothetical protein
VKNIIYKHKTFSEKAEWYFGFADYMPYNGDVLVVLNILVRLWLWVYRWVRFGYSKLLKMPKELS